MTSSARTRDQVLLHRGDTLRFLPTLADESVDSFITDPPYGIDLKLHWNRHRPLSIAGDGHNEARRLWSAFIPEAWRIAKPDTAHLFFGTWKSRWIPDILARHFTIKGCIVWYKSTWGLGHYLRPRWELIWYCHKGKPKRLGAAPPDVWECSRDGRLRHPCQKPVDLLRRAVRMVCPPGGTICDPFFGAGATPLAAVLEGRQFIGCELEPRYVRLTRQRLAEALSTP